MYTLYYLNSNLQIGTIKAETLDNPVLIPEDLIFCNLRKDTEFIKEPDSCADFTDIERLLMSSEFYDTGFIKESDFRKQNTYLDSLCQIDNDFGAIKYHEFNPWYKRIENNALEFYHERYDTPHGTIFPKIYFSEDGRNYQYMGDYEILRAQLIENNTKLLIDDAVLTVKINLYHLDQFKLNPPSNETKELRFIYFEDPRSGAKSKIYDLSYYFEKCAKISQVTTTGFKAVFPDDIIKRIYTCAGNLNLAVKVIRGSETLSFPLEILDQVTGIYYYPLEVFDKVFIVDETAEYLNSEVFTVS